VARDDEHHHADGEDQDVGVLTDQVDEVARRQCQPPGPDLEEKDDQDQGCEDRELPEVGTSTAKDLLDVFDAAHAC